MRSVASVAGNININDYHANVGKLLKTLGQKKKDLCQKVKPNQKILIDQINQLTYGIALIQKYRSRIQIIEERKKKRKVKE